MKSKILLLVALLSFALVEIATAEEVAPGILRTPEERFAGIADFPYEPNYEQIGELRIHYVDVGPRDGEVILLIHGEPTWSYLFRKMIPVFVEAGYRVIAPDLVGFGRSDKYADEDRYSYMLQVDTMSELVRRLDLQDATFFGQDWGGLVGLRLVTGMPERFAHVAVSNTAMPSASGIQGWIGYPLFKFAVWREGALTFEELRQNVTFPRWVAYSYHVEDLPIGQLMSFLSGAGSEETAGVDEVGAAYLAPFPEQRYKAGAQIMPYLVPSQLRENEAAWDVFRNWQKPFLVAFTDSDPVTRGGEQTFLERVPTAQNVTIRGAGHFVQEDAGEALAVLITEFLEGVELPTEIDANYRGTERE